MKAIYIEVSAEVRYWEDSSVNGKIDTDGALIPLRKGDCWVPVIRLSDGLVMDWPKDTIADVHFKVCDAGEYWLLDESRNRIAKWGGYCVPDDFLCPGADGYGDYIIMQIGVDGVVKKWKEQDIQINKPEDDGQCGWTALA